MASERQFSNPNRTESRRLTPPRRRRTEWRADGARSASTVHWRTALALRKGKLMDEKLLGSSSSRAVLAFLLLGEERVRAHLRFSSVFFLSLSLLFHSRLPNIEMRLPRCRLCNSSFELGLSLFMGRVMKSLMGFHVCVRAGVEKLVLAKVAYQQQQWDSITVNNTAIS